MTQPETALTDLARALLDSFNGDYEKTEAELVRRFHDPALLDDVACYCAEEVVMRLKTRVRREIRGIADGSTPGRDRGLGSLGVQFRNRYEEYLLWPLSNKKVLGEATIEDLVKEEHFYRSQGRTMMQRADWFVRIMAQMRRAKAEKVADALTAEQLHRLYQQTHTL